MFTDLLLDKDYKLQKADPKEYDNPPYLFRIIKDSYMGYIDKNNRKYISTLLGALRVYGLDRVKDRLSEKSLTSLIYILQEEEALNNMAEAFNLYTNASIFQLGVDITNLLAYLNSQSIYQKLKRLPEKPKFKTVAEIVNCLSSQVFEERFKEEIEASKKETEKSANGKDKKKS